VDRGFLDNAVYRCITLTPTFRQACATRLLSTFTGLVYAGMQYAIFKVLAFIAFYCFRLGIYFAICATIIAVGSLGVYPRLRKKLYRNGHQIIRD
jgi:hypothetical protein